jgi:hypothetical protein
LLHLVGIYSLTHDARKHATQIHMLVDVRILSPPVPRYFVHAFVRRQ